MFRTEIEIPSFDFKIDQAKRLISLGSCFSDTIGNKLNHAKFSILVNPYGTVFNPLSIFNLLEHAIDLTELDEKGLIQRDDLWLSHELHSSFKASSQAALQKKFMKLNETMHEHITKADLLIITFGTSWVYEKKRGGELVSNCHKVPQKEFNKRLLHVEEIMNSFFSIKEKIQQINPKLKILLTVSPVRHTREGLHGNAVSKSNLLLAAHYMEEMANDVYYFPSYEILMDDLRDYRYVEKDLIHPNEQAIDYIWGHFSRALFSEKALVDHKELVDIQEAIGHVAFNPESHAHQKFLKRTLEKAEGLNKKIGLKEELKLLKERMIND